MQKTLLSEVTRWRAVILFTLSLAEITNTICSRILYRIRYGERRTIQSLVALVPIGIMDMVRCALRANRYWDTLA